MTNPDYILSIEGKGYDEVYKAFNNEYLKNLRITADSKLELLKTYDINGIGVTLIETQDKYRLSNFGNIVFMGGEDLINKTINEIKSKGFKLKKIK